MKHLPILVFDCATRSGRVGLLYEMSWAWRSLGTDRGRSLMPTVAELLHAKKLKLTDLGGFASVTSGPSYTGIRVGASSANALGWVSKKPSVGVATLPDAKTLITLVENASPDTMIAPLYPNNED